MSLSRLTTRAALPATLWSLAGLASAQPSFTIIQPDAGYDYAVIQDVAANGRSVLVSLQQSTTRPDPLKGYVLSLLTGSRTLIAEPSGRDLNPIAMNADGTVVVGSVGGGPLANAEAFVFDSDGLQLIGGLPAGNVTYATGVSADGLVVVGSSGANFGDPYQQGWRWTPSNGFTPLNDLGDDILIFGSAEDISADGSTVVGYGSIGDFDGDTDDLLSAAFWPGGGLIPTDLGSLPNLQPTLGGAFASACSADGSVIVGTSPAIGPGGSFVNRGWRWTAATGMVDLGPLPGSPTGSITISDVSADGNTIVGYFISGGANTWEAVVWTPSTGYRTLRSILAASGVAIPPGIVLRETFCSADARVIAGWAYNLTTQRYVGYIANLGPGCLCRADLNCDGNLDPDDLSSFITCYFAIPACNQADWNGDATVDPDDLSDYITLYFAGC